MRPIGAPSATLDRCIRQIAGCATSAVTTRAPIHSQPRAYNTLTGAHVLVLDNIVGIAADNLARLAVGEPIRNEVRH